jgi:two-component system cell cycle response regulator CtrA
MTLRDDYVAAVESENEQLRERIAELEGLLGMTFPYPPILGLTGSEGRMLGFLLSRDCVTRDALMVCLYGHRPASDETEIKIVDVFICNLRKKLKPFGIDIKTQWGTGYYMTKEAKDAVAALLPKSEAA